MADLRDQLQAALGASYALERELGGGGMSRVFVAEETSLGRRVVVKVLAPELSGGLSAERFRREVQLAARLRHPHVVPLLSAGDAGGVLYYTMPYVEGESLRARLARGGALSLGEAGRVLREVADALSYAHERGVVHRDIKPDNVLLERGHAVVTDFGIAKALTAATAPGTGATAGSATGTGVLLGTPRYMAPEQAAGDPDVDHRADLYALGVLAYELLSGAPPFAGRNAHELVTAHIAALPPPIVERRPDLPAPLAALVMRLLEKRPADRPQSADDVLRVLEALPISSGEVTPREQPARPGVSVRPWLEAGVRHARRHRLKVATAMMLLALLLSFAGVGVFTRSISRRSALSPTPAGRDTVRAAAPAAAAERKSIAVLPFVNAAGDTTSEYFSDGMTDELISALSKVSGLRVPSRSSAFALKGQGLSVREVGERLRVTTVLEGSVRRAGGRLRVSAQLVDAVGDSTLWAESYERDLSDVFAVQDDIARSIASVLEVNLVGGQADRLVAAATTSREAHDLYLRGLYFRNKRTREGMGKAIAAFEQAGRQDTMYALPHATLADTYILLPDYGLAPASQMLPKARAAALRAIALDSTLAEAYASLGLILQYDYEWAAAARAYERALALRPWYPMTYYYSTFLLFGTGRADDAVRQAERGQQMDPYAPLGYVVSGWALFMARRYDGAIAQARRALELDSTYSLAYNVLARSFVEQHRYAEAVDALHTLRRLSGVYQRAAGELGHAYAVSGRRDEALQLLHELERRSRSEYVAPSNFAQIYVGLGDTDRAFAWLERSFDDRAVLMRHLKLDPMFDPIRSDPRFSRLLRRMGLSP